MEVTYETTLKDYVALIRHELLKSASTRAIHLLVWLLPPFIGIVASVAFVTMADLWREGICLAASSMFFVVVFPRVQQAWFEWSIREYAKKIETRGFIGQITLILTDKSITEITETTQSEIRWDVVHGIDVSGDYTFIFVTRLLAAIIPSHGFRSIDEYDAVREFALGHVDADQIRYFA